MKIKVGMLLTVAAIFMVLVGTRQNAAAQEIISENLFRNPGWEAGYYNQDSISQIAVPNEWRMHWLDNVPFEGTDGRPAYRPETVVWNIQDAPERERSVFFRDGSYTLKIFKGWAPMYAGVSQDVSGLEVGRKYRISAPIFVDIVEDYSGGNKVPPGDPRHGFVRFGVGPVGAPWLDASQINYSPYWTAENVNPFYQAMPIFVWDFVATAPDMTIFIEMGSNYPHRNNGFFMDGVGLYATDQTQAGVSNPAAPSGSGGGGGASAAPAPTLAPVEITPNEDGSITHVVGTGDSFWTIAIKYAAALDMSAEQALPHIQELNGNPQFVSAGQELVIREPGEYDDAPAPEEAPEEETGEEGTAEEPIRDGEAAASEETTEDGDVITVEGEEIEESAPAEEAEPAPTAAGPSGICVSAFNDSNGNGTYDGAPESWKADAAITLFKDGNTVTTYITDGVKDIHCFDSLETGTYQVQLYPPANYVPTTADSWAVSVSEGVYIPLEFGMQFSEGGAVEEVADAGDGATASEEESATEGDTAVSPEEEPTTAEASADEGGLMSNLGGILIVVAVALVLLAGAGVVMLRRG